ICSFPPCRARTVRALFAFTRNKKAKWHSVPSMRPFPFPPRGRVTPRKSALGGRCATAFPPAGHLLFFAVNCTYRKFCEEICNTDIPPKAPHRLFGKSHRSEERRVGKGRRGGCAQEV